MPRTGGAAPIIMDGAGARVIASAAAIAPAALNDAAGGGAAAGGVKPRKIAGSIAGYVKAFTSIPSKAAKAWRQGTRTTGESLYIIQCTMVLEYQEEIPGAIHFLIYFFVSHEK